MERQKILLFNDSFPPTIDGVANVTVNYASILQKNYCDAGVVTPYYPGVEDRYDFPVIRYRSVNISNLAFGYRAGDPFSPELIKRVGDEKPTLIHSHCPMASNVLARLCQGKIDAPVVFTYHTKFDIDLKKALRGKLLQEASLKFVVSGISACDEVWVVSEGAGENLRSIGYQGDYVVMENGVDYARGRAPQEKIDEISRLHGLEENVPTFLFVGRMMWYKGVKTSLDGLKAAKDEGLKFRFLLVGDGVDRKEIEDYVGKIGLSENCVFTGAIRDRELLRAYFSRADLFLFPSTFDTNGIVVREAAACSCPSLLIRGSCAAEGIKDGRNGILIEDDPADMKEKVMEASRDLDRLHAIGENAANEIYLSWDDAVSRAYDRYQTVIERYRSRAKEPKHPLADTDLFTLYGSTLYTLGKAETSIEDNRQKFIEIERQFLSLLENGANSSKEHAARLYREWKEQVRETFGDLYERFDRK